MRSSPAVAVSSPQPSVPRRFLDSPDSPISSSSLPVHVNVRRLSDPPARSWQPAVRQAEGRAASTTRRHREHDEHQVQPRRATSQPSSDSPSRASYPGSMRDHPASPRSPSWTGQGPGPVGSFTHEEITSEWPISYNVGRMVRVSLGDRRRGSPPPSMVDCHPRNHRRRSPAPTVRTGIPHRGPRKSP